MDDVDAYAFVPLPRPATLDGQKKFYVEILKLRIQGLNALKDRTKKEDAYLALYEAKLKESEPWSDKQAVERFIADIERVLEALAREASAAAVVSHNRLALKSLQDAKERELALAAQLRKLVGLP